MKAIILVFFCALVNEYVINILKDAFPFLEKGRNAKIASIVIGIAEALLFNADLAAALGFDALIPYAGNVITGVIVAGGSSVLYDFMKKYVKTVKHDIMEFESDLEPGEDTNVPSNDGGVM